MNTNLNKQDALDLHQELYRPDYRVYHSRVIDCIGLDRWLEKAEMAVKGGKSPARYFSYLIKQEMIAYNQEKEVYHSGKTKPVGRSDIS